MGWNPNLPRNLHHPQRSLLMSLDSIGSRSVAVELAADVYLGPFASLSCHLLTILYLVVAIINVSVSVSVSVANFDFNFICVLVESPMELVINGCFDWSIKYE